MRRAIWHSRASPLSIKGSRNFVFHEQVPQPQKVWKPLLQGMKKNSKFSPTIHNKREIREGKAGLKPSTCSPGWEYKRELSIWDSLGMSLLFTISYFEGMATSEFPDLGESQSPCWIALVLLLRSKSGIFYKKTQLLLGWSFKGAKTGAAKHSNTL